VAKAELGTKRVCPTTGRKFYDLNKNPVISPYTGEVVPIVVLPVSRRSMPVAPVAPLAPEVEAPEAADVELVPLEEADAEAEGGNKKEAAVEGEDADEEVEVADTAEDDTFLETDEEGDDVSDIVGGEREDEEDT
jgi:uncharacterized protein (TIGR02300 family)